VFIREPVNSLTHFAGMLAAIPATLFLLRLCRGDRVKIVGMAVYGFSLVACYAGSGLFHAVPPAYEDEASLFDHVGIYLLIGGTVTPIGLTLLRGGWRVLLVGGIWVLAATGILLRLFTDPPLEVRTGLYLVMGWVGCALYFKLAGRLSHAKVAPMWLGGILYSAGAAVNLADFPPRFSARFFTPHELFHVFVLAASACHYYFMLAVLVPFRRLPAFPDEAAPGRLPSAAQMGVVVLTNSVARPGSAVNAEAG
jgi:hemolysin III